MPIFPAEPNDEITEAQRRSFAERLSRSIVDDETAAGEFGDALAATDADSRVDDESYLPFLSSPQARDEIGRLGGYRVLKQLGEGGMGLVFEAEDTKLKRHVALKVMKPEIAVKEQHRFRFIREAQTAAAVEHDHICPIYEVGEENGVPFIAMPFLKGEPLDAYLKRAKPLEVNDAIRIGREVAAGLFAAHEAGLVHRDIKPANVWLETRPNGKNRARILDFGLARGLAEDVQVTASGAILGTPAYMAPEQARGKLVDHRADLFSLGVMLYEMTTGRRPFTGGDTMAILTSLAVDDPTMPHLINPSIPIEFSRLIISLLSKTPEKRPANGRIVSEALLAILTRASRPIVEAIPNADSTAVVEWEALDESDQTDAEPLPVRRDAKALRSAARSPQRARPTDSRKTQRSLLSGTRIAIVVGLLVLIGGGFAVYKFAVQSKDGTLIVEFDGNADARFKSGELQIYDADGKLKYTLKPGQRDMKVPPGKYTVRVVNASGVKLDNDTFEMSKDGKVSLRVMADAVSVAKKEPNPADVAESARRAAADAALPALEAKSKAADVTFTSLAKGVSEFKAKWGGTPAAIKAAELLTTLQSPLDALDSAKIPEDAKAAWKTVGFDGKDIVSVLGEHRGRQVGIIRRVVHHPNGKIIASSGDDGLIHLWHAQTLQELGQFKGASPVFTTDGKMFGIVGTNVCRWNFAENDPGQAIVLMEAPVRTGQLAVTRDGKLMALSHGDPPMISVFELTAKPPKKRGEIKWAAAVIDSLAFYPEGNVLITGSHDKTVRLWDVRADEPKSLGVLNGHTDWVYQSAVSPDGKWIGSVGAWDCTARLWAVEKESAKSAGALPYATATCCMAFSPDSKIFAVGLWTGDVVLYELKPEGPQQKLVLKGLKNHVWSISFSPNGKVLGAGGTEGAIGLWDVETGKEVQPLTGPIGSARHVAISADGRNILISDDGQKVHLLETATGQVVATFAGTRAEFSPDERHLLLSGGTQPVRLVERADGLVVISLPVSNSLAALSPDGKRILSWTGTKLAVWDAKSGQQLHAFESPEGQAFVSASVTADGRRLFANSLGWVLWWDMDTGKEIRRTAYWDHIRSNVALPTGPVVTGSHMSGLLLWDSHADKFSRALPGPANGNAIACSLDGKKLVCASWGGPISVWDVKSGKRLNEWQVPGPVNALAFANDGLHVAAANGNGTVYILRIAETLRSAEKDLNALQTRVADPKADQDSLRKDLLAFRVKYAAFPDQTLRAAEMLMKLPSSLDTLDPAKIPEDARAAWKTIGFDGKDVVGVLGEHSRQRWAGVNHLALAPDGRQFASAAADGTVTLWDAVDRKEIRTWRAHSDTITMMAFQPGGQVLGTCSHGGGTKLWDTATGKTIQVLGGHAGVTALAFSGDGKFLATGGSGDHSIHIWDGETYKHIRTLTGHKGWVMSLAANKDGKIIASGSRDGSVKLWEADTGKESKTLVQLEAPGNHDWQVAFSPDGQSVAASLGKTTVWDVATGKQLHDLPGRSFAAFRTGTQAELVSNNGVDLKSWDLSTGKERWTIKGAACACAAFLPSDRILVSGHADGALRFWEVETGKEVQPLTISTALAVAFSPEDSSVLVGHSGPTILRDIVKGTELRSFDPVAAANVNFSQNGRLACLVCRDGSIRLHDATTGAEVRNLKGFPNNPCSAVLFPEQTRLLVGTDSGYVVVWDILNAIEALRLDVAPGLVSDVDRSPDGRWALCTGITTKLFDLKTGRLMRDVSPGGFHSVSAKFSPDGKIIAIAALDGRVILQDAASGNKLREWQLPGPARGLAFASDGRHLATTNGNGTVYVLRLPSRFESIDSDRATAEWIINNGSFVGIQIDGKDVPIGKDKELPKIPFQVVSLNLNRNKLVNDETLQCMNGLRHLRSVQITNVAVTDKTLTYIKDCNDLESLILYATQITDAGLEVIAGFKKLKNLNITQLPLTKFAVEKLAAALPQCRIVWSGGVIEPKIARHHGIEFDGKTSYVDIPTLSRDEDHPITIEAYVTVSATQGANLVRVEGKSPCQMHGWPGKDAANEWVPNGMDQRGTKCQAGTPPLLPGKRAHVAVQIDEHTVHLYVDGKKVNSVARTSGPGNGSLQGTVIGAGLNPARNTAGVVFSGTLDEVRISKTIRYKEDFTPAKRHEADKDTIALYHCDDGQGDKLTDSSGNNHHGMIVGARWVKGD